MNKTSLLPLLAAAALLAGCRTTQTNHVRRGVIAGGKTAASATQAPRSRVRNSAKNQTSQTAAKPGAGTISETPLVPERPQPVAVQPQPVAVQAQPATVQTQPVANTAPAVPMWTKPSAAAEPAPAPVAAPVATASGTTAYETYVVKSGDVAGRIANSHGMTLKEFREANGMTLEQAGKLRVGQKVKVWAGASPLAAGPAAQPAKPAASDDPDVYVVQSGDTLLGISAKTGVPVATLMSANGIDNPNAIRVGRKLALKKGEAAGTAPVKPVTTTGKPTTTKPTTEKPTTTKPTTDKPTTTKPTATKPTAVKPVTTAAADPAPPPVAVQPPQDASVPLEEVKVAGTDLSVADILDGVSLSEARERAEAKKEETAQQVEKAVQTAADAAQDAADAAPAGYKYYVVKEGETLYHLGARYKVPFKTLRELNNLPSGASKLEAGTRLLIPDTAAAVP